MLIGADCSVKYYSASMCTVTGILSVYVGAWEVVSTVMHGVTSSYINVHFDCVYEICTAIYNGCQLYAGM